ncbi:MAG: hypothetical protein O2960_25145 [Verrucomicrobia bacterium]|nr:hypothetical protein [Verrucomicrobiota bacterium]
MKLIGPTSTTVEVATGTKETVPATRGHYLLKIRYGTPGKYSYNKGDEFDVEETSSAFSKITITLHTVAAGNYGSRAITEEDFEKNDKKSTNIGSAQMSVDPITIRYEGDAIAFTESKEYRRKTALLWRRYFSKNEEWIANCAIVSLGDTGKISPTAPLGLIVSGSLTGLVSIAVWLADAESPYKQISNTLTNKTALKAIGAIPQSLDTFTEFTFTDSDGQKIVVGGRFVAASSARNDAIRYQLSGETKDGLRLGGGLGGENGEICWGGVYSPLKLIDEGAKIKAGGCKEIERATEGLRAERRAANAIVLELKLTQRK